MFLELNGEGIEAPNASAKTVKCLQIASGAVYTDDAGNWSELHDAKLQALDSILTEAAGAPVLVAYHWKHDLERLLKAFPRGRHLDQDPQTLRDWNAGKIPVLFTHPASAGHGLNMQDGGNILVFFSHWWDLEQYQQIIERIGPTRQIQAGHNRPVFIHHIIAASTMDEMVMERRNSKRTVQDILLDAMKKRPVGRRRWLVASIEMITEKEVMQMMRISSRMTIWKYTERYNFPKPIRTHPKQYLLSEVEAWILNGGINPKSS